MEKAAARSDIPEEVDRPREFDGRPVGGKGADPHPPMGERVDCASSCDTCGEWGRQMPAAVEGEYALAHVVPVTRPLQFRHPTVSILHFPGMSRIYVSSREAILCQHATRIHGPLSSPRIVVECATRLVGVKHSIASDTLANTRTVEHIALVGSG